MKPFYSQFTALLLLFIVPAVSSCENDGYSLGDFWLSYGVVTGNYPNFYITLDDGTELSIAANNVPQIKVKDKQRIMVDYTIIGDMLPGESGQKRYSVVLNGLSDILTKDYLSSSNLNSSQLQDSIGYNKADIITKGAWIGSHYLNINFYLRQSNSPIRHMVNLVLNDEKSTDKKIYLTFRHNAYGDEERYETFGRASFDINEILETIEPGASVEFILSWDGYFSENNTESIVYTK